MKKFITRQLREKAFIKGKERTWISSCSDEQLYQIYLLIRAGNSARSIAQIIKEEWKVKSESDIHSLSQGILKFKGRIKEFLELEMGNPAAQESDAASLVKPENLDDLMGLERLVKLHRALVERMIKEEQENGIRHPSLSKDIQSLAALSKVLTREKEFALKHADNDPVKRREEEIRTQRMKANFDAFLAKTSDESRARLIRAVEKLLESAAQDVVEIDVEELENFPQID
jgi:hypothetical protein